jgi:hypothetical protein
VTFLQFHVLLSLIGIASGLIVLYGLVTGQRLGARTALFLVTTVLTSATGFPLPAFGFDPPSAVGVISLILLALAVHGLYVFHLSGAWRWIYVVTAVMALYLSCFVGVIQSFEKIPAVHALAPTQHEPPFLVAQVALLLIFVVLGFVGVKRFHPAR